jgi:DNA anti-recombination protein RmuC
MTSGDEKRLEELRSVVGATQDALAELPDEERRANPEQVRFLESVLDFSSVVLERTDPTLISAAIHSDIVSSANQIRTQPAAALSSADSLGDKLLRAVMRLPVAVGRELDQNVRDAAANFKRAASQRLSALTDEVDAAKARVEELLQEIDSRAEQIGKEITAQAEALAVKVAELEQAITTQRQSLDELMTRHSQTFSATQEERAAAFQQALDAAQEKLSELEQSAKAEVEERVAEIRRMEEESTALVGAIGLVGTAERFGEEAKAHRSRLGTAVTSSAP